MSRGGQRVVWGLLTLGAVAVLVLSRVLTPAAEGVGTHTQLGLPPCGFLTLFSLPCPACGLTTSFAHLSRFALFSALHAHPLGPPLFALVVALLLRSLHGLFTGGSPSALIEHPRAGRAALLLCIALLVCWAARLWAVA